jgi:uncharacterized Zn finger protein
MNPQTILAKVEANRLQRAVEGLVSGAYKVAVTFQDEYRVCGIVTNGDRKPYAVTIGMDDFVACNCPDAVYRKGICKHAVVLALHTIRNPQPTQPEQAQAPAPNLKLAKVSPGFYSRSL